MPKYMVTQTKTTIWRIDALSSKLAERMVKQGRFSAENEIMRTNETIIAAPVEGDEFIADDECACEFDPAPQGEDPQLYYHYRRICPSCGWQTFSLHCEHDGIQGDCCHCGKRLPGRKDKA